MRPPVEFSVFFFSADTAARDYELLLHCSRFADAKGFTAVWIPERHFAQFGGLYPSASVTGAAVAVLTKRIGIRAGSVVLPLHDPIRVAEEWSMIDVLSGGRVAISFASGWHVNDFVLAPDAFVNRRHELLQNIALVQSLWRGQSIARRNGCNQSIDVTVQPRPIQQELPVWLTCQQDASFETAGRHGFNALTNFNYKKPADLKRKVDTYRNAIETHHGRPGHVTLMVHAYVGMSSAGVTASARSAVKRYLLTNLELQETNMNGRASSSDQNCHLSTEDREFLSERAAGQFIEESGFIGTVSSCRERAIALHEMGVDEIACLVDFGLSLPHTLASLKRIAEIRRSLD